MLCFALLQCAMPFDRALCCLRGALVLCPSPLAAPGVVRHPASCCVVHASGVGYFVWFALFLCAVLCCSGVRVPCCLVCCCAVLLALSLALSCKHWLCVPVGVAWCPAAACCLVQCFVVCGAVVRCCVLWFLWCSVVLWLAVFSGVPLRRAALCRLCRVVQICLSPALLLPLLSCCTLLLVVMCRDLLCVWCCAALCWCACVVLLGAGLVCAVSGASGCGAVLSAVLFRLASCGAVVLSCCVVWFVVVPCCPVLCPLVLCCLVMLCCRLF